MTNSQALNGRRWIPVLAVAALILIYRTLVTAQPVFEDRGAALTHLLRTHGLSLIVHGMASGLVGMIGYKVWRDAESGWAAGLLFLLHPLAVPAVAYAQALPEMLVAQLALYGLTVVLFPAWRIGLLLLLAAATFKPSAIGVVTLPLVLTLTVRPWRAARGWCLLGGILGAAVAGWLAWDRLGAVLAPPSHMAVQATAVWGHALQSVVPFGIALQRDWGAAPLELQIAMLLLLPIVGVWAIVKGRTYPVEAFAILWIFALVGVRVIVPTQVNNMGVVRSPEVLYAQQWYPALPGMVWLMVGLGRRLFGKDVPCE